MEWQYELINRLFEEHGCKSKDLSSMPIESMLGVKKENLKFSLYKYYAPTIENISDVANQLVWLANPNSFNDPEDCKLNIDEKFDIYTFSKLIEDSDDLTDEKKSIIFHASRKGRNVTSPEVWPIYNSSKGIVEQISNLKFRVMEYIDFLKQSKYRIACFVQSFSKLYEFDTLMWAHYADNFRGFRVEYDVEKIFDFIYSDFSVYDCSLLNKSIAGFLDKDVLKRVIINGLFPVVYASEKKRPKISKAIAFKIAQEIIRGIDFVQIEQMFPNISKEYVRALITKDNVWKYEREWRLIVSDDVVKDIGYKIPFPFIKNIEPGITASRELRLLINHIKEKLKIGNTY